MRKWLSKARPKAKESPAGVTIHARQDHPMIVLERELNWKELLETVARIRRIRGLGPTGRKPHLRQLTGAVVVRSLESCTLRKASDLIAHYVPARILCGLQRSSWTPDFRTLFDFETLLGDDGLAEINGIVLRSAKELGFADIRGLCADTTAQEAKIPYPNEVSLMNSFARSVKRGFSRLGTAASGAVRTVSRTIEKIRLKVRAHRLFAKSKEERLKTARALARLTHRLRSDLSHALGRAARQRCEAWDGQKSKAFNRLFQLESVMKKLLPQIEFWIRTGFVAKDKIVSLFAPEVWAIKRGKIAKDVEFGLKWGINQIRGGYIALFDIPGKNADVDYAPEAVIHHQEIFGVSPDEFGFDRAGWSQEHMDRIRKEGVKRIAIAPKGQARWRVSESCRKRIQSERAQVEGKIGTIKLYGFNKPNARSTASMRRSARRAELRFNMTRLLKDLALQPAHAADSA
jgi:IS5 family transposase